MNSTLDNSFAAALRHMQTFALFVCVLSLPIQGLALVPGTGLTLTKIAGAGLVLLVATERLALRKWPFPRIGIESAVILALAAGALSLSTSVARAESLRALVIFAEYALICYACAHVAMRDNDQRYIPWLIVLGGALSGAGGLCVQAGFPVSPTVDTQILGSGVRRICFGLPDANEQAMLLVFALALLLFAPKPNLRRWLWPALAVSFLFIAGGLVLTMSRTGWVCGALIIAARALIHPRRGMFVALLLAAVAASVVTVSIVRPDIVDSVKRRLAETTGSGDRSIASRVVYDVKAIASAEHGGAFGYGLGNVYRVTQDFTDPLGRRVGVTVHNVPLTVWIETGWFGLAAFLWLWSCIGAVLLTAWRQATMSIVKYRIGAYGAVALAYAVFCQTMPFLQRSCLPILLGCALGAAAIELRSSNEATSNDISA